MMINCGKCKEEVGEIKSQEFYFGKNLVKKTTKISEGFLKNMIN